MTDLFLPLPPDILDIVLSYITQQECLECMCVSHSWFELIPSYTRTVWRTLDTICEWRSKSTRLLHCLKGTVQEVSIPFLDIFPVLYSLKAQQCIIKSVVIFNGPQLFIEEFIGQITFENTLASALLMYSCHLTHLTVYSYPQKLRLVHLVVACPFIIHLTVLPPYGESSYPDVPSYSEDYSALPDLDIVYLHLNSRLAWNDRVMPLLSKCPKLQCLQLSGNILEYLEITRNNTWWKGHFRNLRKTCPSLNYLECDTTGICQPYDNLVPLDGLREFRFYGDLINLSAEVMPVIEESKDTLEILHINHETRGVYGSERLYRFGSLHIPNLQQIKLIAGVGFAIDKFGELLCNNRSSLEVLELNIDEESFNNIAVNEFCSLYQLQRLKVAIIHEAHSLSLQLDMNSLVDHIETPLEQFLSGTSGSSLQEIKLTGIGISYRALAGLGSMRYLQSLSLDPRGRKIPTSQGLIDFIADVNANNVPLKHIEYMSMESLDDKVMAALGTISSLRTLSLTGPHKVTDTGLKVFLDKVNKRFTWIEFDLWHCGVTKHGVQYAISKLGSKNVRAKFKQSYVVQ